MAKTRLQAKYDDTDEQGDSTTKIVEGKRIKKKERYSGAIDCLTQVYRESGPTGWYRVRSFDADIAISFVRPLIPEMEECTGYASSNYKGSLVSSSFVRNQGCSRSLFVYFATSSLLCCVRPYELILIVFSHHTDTIASLVALSKTRGSAIGLQQI